MRSPIPKAEPITPPITDKPTRSNLAYCALVFFSLAYFVRPEDFIPGLDVIPIGKISGGIALLALIFIVPMRRCKLTIELKVLLLLLGQMILCIPFASWRSGALDTVVNKFSKGIIVAFLIYMVATSLNEVRRLLTIQAGTVALITIASLLVHHTEFGRLMGIQKGILENPNDLAINIAINFPLCVAFLFAAKKMGSKAFWSISLIFMVWAVIATYSRSGLIAMVVSILVCLWEFGIRGKRTMVMVSAVFVGMVAIGVIAVTPNYLIRVESIFRGNIEGSGDRNSREARKQLLIDSLTIMTAHPVFGIGPGDLPSYTRTWRVAHNTYAELGAETGVPGFLLFVLLLGLTLRKIKRIRKLPGYESSEDIRLWTSGLWAAMAAYIAGALFSSTEYNLFPYFMVGYVCAVYQIASHPQMVGEPQQQSKGDKKIPNRLRRRKELVWSR